MGLIKKLVEKLHKKNEIVLENFDENYYRNQKIANKLFNKMKKGCLVIRKRPEVQYYIPDIIEVSDELILDIMEQTNSQPYSYNFGNIITFVKLYAINYVATQEGKSYQEVKYACECLFDAIDSLNLNFLAHINCDTDYEASYINDSFAVTKDSYASKLVKNVNKINHVIFDIAEGMLHKDKEAVFYGYERLCDKTLYIIDDKAEEIFGL